LTVSRSGHTVASIRLRISVSASSGTSTWNERTALLVSCAIEVMAEPALRGSQLL
jgi:hypothetical protein